MIGLWVLLGTLVVATAAGLLLRRRDGRIKQPKMTSDLPTPVAEALDETAPVTLVQLSTTFCAPCRQTRALLTHLAGRTAGLAHVDLDVTNQPEVAQRLGVLRTPTTVAYAPDGRELLRVGGVPKAPDLLEALSPYLKMSA